jgi:hypothetical protein
MKRHSSGIVVAALALGLLTGCGAAKDSNDGSANSTNAKSTSGPQQGAAVDQANNGAGEIGIDQPDPSKTLYSKQFAIPGKPQRKVTVGILSLERKDRIAILKVVVTPEFADLPASELIPFQDALGQSGWHWTPTLLDLTNLKKYKVLHGNGEFLNLEKGQAISGQPIYGWAVFAAPPAGVTRLDLNVTDWMPRITNLSIR